MFDVVIVGGGIVGLASAYKLLRARPKSSVLVLEKETEIATHQSAHNSGVIHSGIYYKPGSLKARIAARGAVELVRFCQEHGVAFELCGKVIVATSEEERVRLGVLLERGRANGVPSLRAIGRDELREIEPHAEGVAALHSPSTGIVSFREVARKLASEIESRGGCIETGAELLGARIEESALRLHTTGGEALARRVVTAGGLHADRVAARFGDEPLLLQILPFRGEYYRLKEKSRHLVRNLIYPVPDPRLPFLGVHFTRRIDGVVEAGPNAVLALAREGYGKTDVRLRDLWEMARFPGTYRMARKFFRIGLDEYRRSFSKERFVRSLRKLVPEIASDDLEAGGSGVRAMAVDRDGSLVDDFRVVRGGPEGRVVHVLNAPSPAATSSLAIASHVLQYGLELGSF